MPERLTTPTIDITQRQALITSLACFSMLTPAESAELAAVATEIQYAPGECIVEDDAIVDSVFIIVSGQAEVSKQLAVKKKKLKLKIKKTPKFEKIPLAMMEPGEAIGLNNTGFFSDTGKRTATVSAITEVLVLSFDLKKLHQFLQHHTHLQSAMYARAEEMLRIRFIKQSLPFSRLSYERLTWLANQVEEMQVAEGDIIFKQGDIGDRCYLIHSGEVEIVTTNEQGTEHQLAILSTPTLFGEATLITHAPRNATARALKECRLLMLKHEYLSELIESEGNVAGMFMTLMVDRSRPLQNPNVVAHHRTTADEQTVVILKNPDNGSYFKLSEEGWFIWQQMNGEQTMQEITLELSEKYNVFAPDIVAALISKLARAGFIGNIDVNEDGKLASQPKWVRAMLRVRSILESRVALGDADVWLTKLYQKCAHLFFTQIGKIIITAFILIGFVAFGIATPRAITLFRDIHDSWVLLVFLIPFSLLSVALHELGHALATKSFGYEVHYMGVGWYWLGPVAFTDTSDMWLSTRGPRIFVNMAGIIMDTIVGGLAALLFFALPGAHLQAFLWLFALFTYISAFRMLSPLQELDGYYVLMDLFDKPRLRQFAVIWLVKEFPKALRKPALFRKHIPEVSYWIACIAFLILVSTLTLVVQSFVFKILGFKPSNPMVSLTLPIIVMITSSLGIIADLRSQAED